MAAVARPWPLLGLLGLVIAATALAVVIGLLAWQAGGRAGERPDPSEAHSDATGPPGAAPAKGTRMTVSGRLDLITTNLDGLMEWLEQKEQPETKGALVVKMRRGEATCFMNQRPEHYMHLIPGSRVTIEGELLDGLSHTVDGAAYLYLTDCTLLSGGR